MFSSLIIFIVYYDERWEKFLITFIRKIFYRNARRDDKLNETDPLALGFVNRA